MNSWYKFKGLIIFTIVFSALNIISSNALNNQFILNNSDEIGWHIDKINAQDAWAITNGSESVVIALIDSGVDFSHSELNDSAWVNTDEVNDNGIDDDGNGYIDDILGWDFVSDDNVPGPELSDPVNSHATLLSGIITAKVNGIGVAGIAQNVKIMDCRVLNEDNFAGTTYAGLGEAIKYAADNGADVISMSLQYYGDDLNYYDDIVYAINKNIPVVSITGNTFPESGGGKEYKSYPGGYDEVISVGATNCYDEKADYSNYGDWTDIVAPVGDSEYDSLDELVRSTFPGESYAYGIGTSCACPQVAATIALMKSLYEKITVAEVKEILYETATDLGEEGKDIYFGYGLLNTGAAIEETYERFIKKITIPFLVVFPSIFLILILKKYKKKK